MRLPRCHPTLAPAARPPFASRLDGASAGRLLWMAGIVMVLFGVAELPALARMSAHGTGVLGFEFAGSSSRLRQVLVGWGPAGLAAAREHVLIDLGFIVGYAVLLVSACGRVWARFAPSGHTRSAGAAALMAWAALIAAAVNGFQKVLLWLELHGHVAQPLPVIAALCAAITFTLAFSAALFALSAALAARRLSTAETLTGGTG